MIRSSPIRPKRATWHSILRDPRSPAYQGNEKCVERHHKRRGKLGAWLETKWSSCFCAFGLVLCGLVWFGLVWFGLVWYGMVWYGVVWYGVVWYGMVWYGMVWYGMVWYDMIWYCVWYGKVRQGMVLLTPCCFT